MHHNIVSWIIRPPARTREHTALIREGGEVESYHVIRLQGSELGRWGWWHMRLKPERTAYIPQQFKTKLRPQTGPNKSGVFDDSIRLTTTFFTDVHLQTIAIGIVARGSGGIQVDTYTYR